MAHDAPIPNGPRAQVDDTEAWAERLQIEHWGRMSPREKCDLLRELCASAHRLARAGMAARHPDASDEELELRLACVRRGRATVEQVLGRPLPFADDGA